MSMREHLIKVQGGTEYLPVAPRVVAFRKDWPLATDWLPDQAIIGINTKAVTIADRPMMRAEARLFWAEGPEGGVFLANAHKAIGGGKGAAKQYPVESAETGAIGRLLSLLGYGTLDAQDLEEFDELADSPQPPKGAGNTPTTSAEARAELSELAEAVPAILALQPGPDRTEALAGVASAIAKQCVKEAEKYAITDKRATYLVTLLRKLEGLLAQPEHDGLADEPRAGATVQLRTAIGLFA